MAWIIKRHMETDREILYDTGSGQRWIVPHETRLLPEVFLTRTEAEFEAKVYKRMMPEWDYEVTEYLR